MVDAPDKIWAAVKTPSAGDWWHRNAAGATEYIRSDLVAELAAENERLKELIRWAHDTLYEINPSNYDHDEVCKLNDASVEVILGLAPILGETHGKSKEWWSSRTKPLSSTGAVKVKALEWAELNEGKVFRALLPVIGSIRIEPYGVCGWWEVLWSMPGQCDKLIPDVFDTPDEAKAAAQADYERRILSSLEPTPPEGQQEPVGWLHPTSKWAHCEHDYVANHCRKNGPGPIPLYTRPSEQAVSEAMIAAAADEIVDTAEIDFNGTIINRMDVARKALKAAMEAGR